MSYDAPSPVETAPGDGLDPRPGTSAGGRVVTIVLLVLTWLGVAVGGFAALILLAFTDYCPPESCSVDGAIAAVAAGIGGSLVIALAGTIVGVTRMRRHRGAWLIALLTMLLAAACWLGGVLGYFAAVS
ncbi:MAG: hypothetical protein ACR2FG_05650 [Marmoricola sp.]